MHVEGVPFFSLGEDLYGKYIGKIADLGSNSHLHLGYRGKKFDPSLSIKGALPPAICTSGTQNLPAFSEAFYWPNKNIV
jgi:hypothetical protein